MPGTQRADQRPRRRIRPIDAIGVRRQTLVAELRQVDAQLQHYAAAIGTVGAIPAVTAALRDRDAQRLRLQEQVAALDAAQTKARQPFSGARLRKDLRRRMDDWRSLLCRQTPVARQILTKLIDGRLVFSPHPDEQVYRFTGTATLGNLLQGLVIVGGPDPSPLVSDPVGDATPTVTVQGIVRVA